LLKSSVLIVGTEGIDLSELLRRPGFRADMLYFLRMAGAYLETIFTDARGNWKVNRLKAYQTIIDARSAKEPTEQKFLAAMRRQDPGIEFVFKKEFTYLLAHLEPTHKAHIRRRLLWEHALPWDFNGYDNVIETLRTYRHYLEHFDEKIGKDEKRPADTRVLKYLGLLLLPHLHNHLLGRVIHHERKLALRKKPYSDAVRSILRDAETDRRETSRNLFGLKTRQLLPRSERLDRETYNQRWKERFPLWFAADTWPRYNEHNFKIRYHFMGQARLKALGQALQNSASANGYFADAAQCDFIRELEPLYYATLDINLILHKQLAEREAAGVEIKSAKKVGALIPALRNEIAHGGFFWQVKNKSNNNGIYTLPEVFGAVQRLCPNKESRNDLTTALAAVIKAYGAHRVLDRQGLSHNPNQNPPPHIIHRWTADKRAKYASRDRWHIDRRPRLRAVLAQWKRALLAAPCEKN
jgi:hypothetical protein